MQASKMITISKGSNINLEGMVNIILYEYKYRPDIEQVDVSMFPDNTQKEILNALGEWHITYKGWKDFDRAITFFTRSNNLDKLVELGNGLLSKDNWVEKAEKAFQAAGKKITPAQYNAVGDMLKAKKNYYRAIDPYTKARNKVALLELGKICLEKGHIGWAEHAFEATGRKISKTKYKQVGDACLHKKKLDSIYANPLYIALEAYKKAEYKTGMCKVGDEYIKQGDLENAQKAYKMANQELKLTPKQYSKIGYINLRKHKYREAISAYKAAHNKNKLVEIAQSFVEKGDLYCAKLAYRAARLRFPRKQALYIAELKFKKADMIDAYRAYCLAGNQLMTSFTRQFVPEGMRLSKK